MATATQAAVIETAPAPTILRQVEESAILAVWEHGKKHNIEFGRLCYEYGQKYGAQGSANSGLAQFLRKHSINEGVAYYWIGVHKASVGKGVPCPHCTDTFPSKTQLKKHESKAHPSVRVPYAVKNYSDINPETGRPYNTPSSRPETVEGVGTVTVNDEKDSGNYHRGHGMAMSRWRPIAESLGYKLGCDNDNFILSKDGVKTNLGCHEHGLREFLRAKQALVPEPVEPVKQPSVKPIVVPNISTDSISNHTARLTEFWSHFNALNGVAKNIRTGVDKPTEASTLITLLQRISKDAAEKAVLIQNALDGVS